MFPFRTPQKNASFNAVCFWKETNTSWQDLAFQAFNDPKSINREASETTLLGVTLGGWNALLTSGLLEGGNDVMVVSSRFLLCSFLFFVSSGLLSFWYAMIIAVELLLICWNVLTVDKNIGCLEDDPFSKLTWSSQNGGFVLGTSSTQSNLVYMLYHLETKYQTCVFFCFFYIIYDHRYQSSILLTMKLPGREESPSPIGVDKKPASWPMWSSPGLQPTMRWWIDGGIFGKTSLSGKLWQDFLVVWNCCLMFGCLKFLPLLYLCFWRNPMFWYMFWNLNMNFYSSKMF